MVQPIQPPTHPIPITLPAFIPLASPVSGPEESDIETKINYINVTNPTGSATLGSHPVFKPSQKAKHSRLVSVVTNAVNLGAFDFTISYNPGILEALSAEIGSFPGSTGRTFTPSPFVINRWTNQLWRFQLGDNSKRSQRQRYPGNHYFPGPGRWN